MTDHAERPDLERRVLEVLSLGAGVQSTTVFLMSCLGELPKLDCAIFADTGWEPKAVYSHLEWLKGVAHDFGVRLETVTAGNIRDDATGAQIHVGRQENPNGRFASMPLRVLKNWQPGDESELEAAIAAYEQTGLVGAINEFIEVNSDEPDDERRLATKLRGILDTVRRGGVVKQEGMIRRQCTKEYKIEPIERFVKTELLGLRKPRQRWPKTVEVRQWFGISLDEIRRMRSSQNKWSVNYYPLVEARMTRQKCLEWMEAKGFPRPPRSACIGCPFRSNKEWRDLKDNSPKEFADAVEFDAAIRNCGGMRGQVFLHRQLIPLDQVNLTTDVERGQGVLWDDECSGHCGV